MAEPDAPTPRWRLDAVALTLLAGWLTFAVGVFSASPVTGGRSWLGTVGEWLAVPVLDALGWGTALLVVGGVVWVALYVARRSWVRLGVRGGGWLLFAVCGAVLADFAAPLLGFATVSAYGKGGAIGAWLRFALQDYTTPVLSVTLLSLGFAVAFLLTMDNVVLAVLRRAWGVLKRVNAVVCVVGDQFLQGFAGVWRQWQESRRKRAAEAEPIPLVPTAATESIPIVRHTEIPSEPPAAEVTAEPPAEVPITTLADLPPPDDEYSPTNLPAGYRLPSVNLLADPDFYPVEDQEQKLRDRAVLLEKTFADFGLSVKVVGIHTGPVITQYEIALETGLRLNKVTTLADDLALNLGVQSVRIVAPLPNRTTVGLEVPNDHRQTVRLKELILHTNGKAAKLKLPVFLGKDVEGRPLVYDLATMPHLLIAGRTGTGKSVCLNVIIHSFLLTRTPDECRLILIDPKKVEFSDYARIPHLMHPVVVDDKKAEAILGWAVDKMEERYELLRRARVRNIASYNELAFDDLVRRVAPQTDDERKAIPRKLPYIVLVVDEVGDLLMSMKKEVESHIIRLAQKSRAAGIHLILATQKPTVDVITGLIKSNLPARICFQVASRADSAVVLDEKGAEKLLGMGDMLFLQPGTSTILRGQGAYVDDKEIERVTGELAQYEPNFESELLNLKAKDARDDGDFAEKLRDRDPLYEQAIDIVVREQRGSTSLLQRALGIGYGRASRLIDFMAEDGIVGTFNGSNARDVLVSTEEWEERKKGA